MRKLKDLLKSCILFFYKLGVRLGVHILPVHYYSTIPNIIELKKTRKQWARKSEMVGINVDLDKQIEILSKICGPFQNEYAGNKNYVDGVLNNFGPGYGYIEAQALHSVVRFYKPKNIVEVGSGVSTYCMVKADELNKKETGENAKITSIEPYPSMALKNLAGVNLRPEKVQLTPMEIFTSLGRNDFLFIDSSHTVKAGGDVNFLILEVLPRLKPGVIIHFHDIYLPYDYQRNILKAFLFSSETTLLRAFLTFNSKFEILFCLSHLHYEKREELLRIFPEYVPQTEEDGLIDGKYANFGALKEHFPSSIYIQNVCTEN